MLYSGGKAQTGWLVLFITKRNALDCLISTYEKEKGFGRRNLPFWNSETETIKQLRLMIESFEPGYLSLAALHKIKYYLSKHTTKENTATQKSLQGLLNLLVSQYRITQYLQQLWPFQRAPLYVSATEELMQQTMTPHISDALACSLLMAECVCVYHCDNAIWAIGIVSMLPHPQNPSISSLLMLGVLLTLDLTISNQCSFSVALICANLCQKLCNGVLTRVESNSPLIQSWQKAYPNTYRTARTLVSDISFFIGGYLGQILMQTIMHAKPEPSEEQQHKRSAPPPAPSHRHSQQHKGSTPPPAPPHRHSQYKHQSSTPPPAAPRAQPNTYAALHPQSCLKDKLDQATYSAVSEKCNNMRYHTYSLCKHAASSLFADCNNKSKRMLMKHCHPDARLRHLNAADPLRQQVDKAATNDMQVLSALYAVCNHR